MDDANPVSSALAGRKLLFSIRQPRLTRVSRSDPDSSVAASRGEATVAVEVKMAPQPWDGGDEGLGQDCWM